MTVDIVLKHEKSYSVISEIYVGPYSGSNMLRKQFNDLVRWAKKEHVRTGKWFFLELDGPDTPANRRRWEACVEVKGLTKRKWAELHSDNEKGIQFKELPAVRVASVTFDPDVISSRLVYHGLECWLDWRRKYRELEEAGPTREVYIGNPWTNAKAWANLDVQVPVRALSGKRART